MTSLYFKLYWGEKKAHFIFNKNYKPEHVYFIDTLLM